MADPDFQPGTSPTRDSELWEAAMGHSAQHFQEQQQAQAQFPQQSSAAGLRAQAQPSMQQSTRRQSQQQSSLPQSSFQQYPGGMMGLPPNYGIPTSHAPMDQPEMLRSNHPAYSLPVPGANRQADHMASFQYEAPAAVSQAPQMGRPIGNIGQVGGPSIGKVGSSSSIGSIGQMAPPPSIGRVNMGHAGGQTSRGIGQMGSAGIGQVGPSGIGHAGSGIGQVPSIGHTGSGIGQVGMKLGHAGSGIGQIGATGNEMALARPNVGHLPHSLSAKQQSLLNYAGGSGQYGHMGHMMGWPMGGQAHGMIGTLGGPPPGSLPYSQAPSNMGAMYGYGAGGMMGGAQMQGAGLPHRPGSIHAPSPYADPSGPPSLPNHVSIHSVPESSTSADPGLDKLTSAASLAHQTSNVRGPKIKIICSSGGHFQKMTGGGMEYVGGETRLISVASTCNFTELSAALDRVTGSLTIHSGQSIASGSDSAPSLRYQLPSDPNVYVDLLDTEDVKMMFDEWQEWLAEEKRPSSSKLHVYIQNVGTKAPSDAPTTPNATQPASAFSKVTSGKGPEGAAGPNRNSDTSSAGEEPRQGQSQGAPGSLASNDSWKKKGLEDIAERMEVISPEDVSLVKFIGSGGYGEVYLGKWHSSEAAIKCLNTSLFTSTSDSGARVSHAAINELIREAELLGSLRHPNVVWVYGIVLPPVEEQESSEDLDALIDSAEPIEIASAMSHPSPAPGGRTGPGTLRPPAIITEFMSQGSLKGALSRKLEILQPPLMRLMVALDAAKGMEYLHAKRIVHFDLKSANLLLGHRDKRLICKVADFGLSKQKRDTYVTGVTSQRGTLPWIAPEIIKSPHAVNEKVDVFSFGVVLWEIWTGKEPYEGLNYHALLHQLTSVSGLRPPLPGSPEWEREGNTPLAELAPGYCSLMQRCWSESPSQRPTFHQVVGSLREMANAIRPAPKQRPGPPGLRPGAPSPA